MTQHCHSCSMPLNAPGAQGPSATYCKHCADERGNLRSRQVVEQGIASWLAGWQAIPMEAALTRAKHFMRAMPAWTDD